MRLAADANVLLSAVLGGRARAVLEHPNVQEILTTETILAEVQEYAPLLKGPTGSATPTSSMAAMLPGTSTPRPSPPRRSS